MGRGDPADRRVQRGEGPFGDQLGHVVNTCETQILARMEATAA